MKQVQQDIWEKWDWLWQAIFAATIVIAAGLALLTTNLATPPWQIGLLTVALVVWHAGGMRVAYRKADAWEAQSLSRFIVLVGDIALWFVLVSITPIFYVVLFGLYIEVFHHLPIRFAGLTALLLTLVMVIEQALDSGVALTLSNVNNWLFVLTGLASIVIGMWISALIGQSTRRRELIAQLEATQTELAAAERREGVLQERQRLAHEIHDTLAQGFTSIVMHLESAEQALNNDPVTVHKHLNLARTTARTSLDEARRVVQDLRPDLLEQHSLAHAIARIAQRWQAETDIPITLQTTGSVLPLHPDIEVTLLRATQEALNNIRKHAQATAAQVTLSYMPDVIMLDVNDNGVGLASARPSPFAGGYGLQAMRERTQQLGGSLTIESDPGQGTTIVVTVPLTTADA